MIDVGMEKNRGDKEESKGYNDGQTKEHRLTKNEVDVTSRKGIRREIAE